MTRAVVLGVLFLTWAASPFAQTTVDRDDALLEALVWGTYESMSTQTYPEEMRQEVDDYVRRVRQNCPTMSVPSQSQLERIHTAQIRSACRLAAMSDEREAPRLAEAYTIGLRPCDEWNGLHDCPEHEARFADEYHLVHLSGPFRGYLPLLSAHRWLCAAEGYEQEGRRSEAYLSRRWSEQRLGAALRSESQLVRVAAETLMVRRRCFAER